LKLVHAERASVLTRPEGGGRLNDPSIVAVEATRSLAM